MIRHDPLAVRVAAIEPLSATLKRLTLESADGGALPIGSAGAHVSLILEGGDRPFRNAYSLVSMPGERGCYELIVRRTAGSRGGSAFIHERLGEGSVIGATVPHNLFPIQRHARKHLLIGGGIGITPLLSYLPALRQGGERLELHQISARDEVPLFENLLAPHAAHDVHVHAGRGALDLSALLARQPLGTHVYVCGPAALMDHVEAAAAALGWPASRVHRENFGAAGGDPFTLRLARSGREIAVGPDQSMLDALEAAGVPVPSLCRGGACGECLTKVTGGVPEHRDHYLTDLEKAEGALVMPCVSRAKNDLLVLDL
ncbi:oxidoreductase [Sphingomonas oleivorans]|uniref:Oxidoreductase n=1 Tax=Sphingomonas oleivorans TaxID=1735121 RepID=A0A2T5G0R2_9SPHN|nr:PDR/VanB family oxidoreductase [Sphingomonas oleivorans]PTQ12723.1 oxidoreductase [Sphingomonas oleivorans]